MGRDSSILKGGPRHAPPKDDPKIEKTKFKAWIESCLSVLSTLEARLMGNRDWEVRANGTRQARRTG